MIEKKSSTVLEDEEGSKKINEAGFSEANLDGELQDNESIIQPEDREYLEILIEMVKDVLERLKDLEIEKTEKNNTIELLKKLMG
jgi:hypothetical protein